MGKSGGYGGYSGARSGYAGPAGQALGQVYHLSPAEQKLGRPFNQQEMDQQRAALFGNTGSSRATEQQMDQLRGALYQQPSRPPASTPWGSGVGMPYYGPQYYGQPTPAPSMATSPNPLSQNMVQQQQTQPAASAAGQPGQSYGSSQPTMLQGGIQGLPSSNPMAGQMNALLNQQLMAQQPQPDPMSTMLQGGIQGLPSSNPMSGPMNAALNQQLMWQDMQNQQQPPMMGAGSAGGSPDLLPWQNLTSGMTGF